MRTRGARAATSSGMYLRAGSCFSRKCLLHAPQCRSFNEEGFDQKRAAAGPWHSHNTHSLTARASSASAGGQPAGQLRCGARGSVCATYQVTKMMRGMVRKRMAAW